MSGAKGTVTQLAYNQTTTGVSIPTKQIEPNKAFQGVVTTTSGNGSATILIEGSLDGVNYATVVTLTIASGSSGANAIAAGNYPYPFIRSNVTAISGTGAQANAYCAV